MSGPTEFTLESVRQYMLAQDGRVTNHELVKYFKAWLTHPTEKDNARQRFKEYVNTLATIKQENGEKYLMLKKRFYPNFDDDPGPPPPQSHQGYSHSQPPQHHHHHPPQQQQKVRSPSSMPSSEPSLLDEVMAGYQSLSYGQQPPQSQHSRPPPQHQPPQQQRRMLPSTPQYRPQIPPPTDLGLPIAPPASSVGGGGGSSSSYYSASPTHSQRSSYASLAQSDMGPGGPRIPPPYRPPPYRHAPPPSSNYGPPSQGHGDLGLPVAPPPSNYGLPTSMSRQSSYASQSSMDQHSNPSMSRQTSYSSQSSLPMMMMGDPPPLPRRNGVVEPPQQFYTNPAMAQRGPPPPPPKASQSPPPPPLPTRPPPNAAGPAGSFLGGSQTSIANSGSGGQISRQMSHSSSCEDNNKENSPSVSSSDPSGVSRDSPDGGCSSSSASNSRSNSISAASGNGLGGVAELAPTPQQLKKEQDEKISVKERTKTFNRMASQVMLNLTLFPPVLCSRRFFLFFR